MAEALRNKALLEIPPDAPRQLEGSGPETLARYPSLEDFLAAGEDTAWWEWVGGETVRMSPASLRHQELNLWLSSLLALWVETQGSGLLLTAPFAMVLADQDRIREPDILFIAEQNRDRLAPAYLRGPADLVVEIVSADSVGRDRGEKFVEYETAGIPEYWLIDPHRRQAELYALGEDGCYHPSAVSDDGWMESRVLAGFRLRPSWLFQENLPKVLDVAREIGIL